MIKRKFFVWGMSFLFLCLATNSHADVTKESTNQMDFKGTLGAVLKFFGAGKPTTTAEYYKGDVYKSDTIDEKGKVTNSQIIDLDKELFITIDYQKKRYTQMTFDEWRKMMQENIQKMEAGQEKNKEKSPEVEWKFDMNVSKPGETETIAGKKAEKVIIKMDISAKATPQEQTEEQAQNAQGEMTVTSTYWMVNEMEGQKEIENFYKKLAEKLGFLPGQGGMEAIMS